MAATTNFKIDGAAEMVRLLKELGPRVADRVGDQALRAGAKPIVTRAKELAPVLTGQLRDDIAAEIERQGKGSDTRRIEIGVRKPTSRRFHLSEFGTAHNPAHPFMRPALDEKASPALDEMGRVLAKGIEREAIKLVKK